MTDDEYHQAISDAMDEHAKLIGNVSVTWNLAQSLVFAIFGQLSGLPFEKAQAVFFALKTDFAQRDITIAVVDVELSEHPELCDKIKAPIHRLTQLTNERNAAIHTIWRLADGEAKVVPQLLVKHPPALDVDDPAGQMARLEQKLTSTNDALIEAIMQAAHYTASRDGQDPDNAGKKEEA